ncbi:unnamed protein product [Paramecium pentaurelia]|uniref:Protein kinase domain-containing protein n=1 Tax=Paramecium pentaurelia TaxID=43138 RepID=A0A8S1X897_9CILI|nr:unnamed protein product [Paramecium pentaurelia]
MQQQITPEQGQNIINDQIEELQRNTLQEEQEQIGEGAQGICYRFEQRVYKFLNIQNSFLSLEELRQMNRFEQLCLQQLASSDYTCEIQRNICDNDFNLWIATAYMNQGSLNMDCLINNNYINDRLSLETLSIICKRLIKILNYFHHNCIFHLDVKPENILLHEEYQFYYSTDNINQEYKIEDGLQMLRNQLSNEQIQMQYKYDIQPDYLNLQQILSRFQILQPNDRIIITNVRFSQIEVHQLIYWIEKWLRFQNRLQFNPQNIYVKKGIKICFCDFGLARQFNNQDINRPIFEYGFYKTPYQILGGIVQQQYQIEARMIARQEDLFRLGITLCYLLNTNQHIQFKDIQFDQKILLQFLQQTYNQNNINLNNILIDDQQRLLQYYSFINELRRQQAIQNQFGTQNNATNQFLRMIIEMLSFSFTPSNYFYVNQEDQELPLNNIKNVKGICKILENQQRV